MTCGPNMVPRRRIDELCRLKIYDAGGDFLMTVPALGSDVVVAVHSDDEYPTDELIHVTSDHQRD